MTETARPTAPIPAFLSEQAQAVLAAQPDVRQYPDLDDTEG